MVLNGDEGLECEVRADGMQLEYWSEFKYLGCVLNATGTDEAECSGKGKVGGGLQVLLVLWLMR